VSEPRADVEAERGVLGAILVVGVDALDVLQEAGLQPEHFYMPSHETLYRAAQRLGAKGSAIDYRLLGGALTKEERRTVGDPRTLIEMVETASPVPLLGAHADQLIACSLLRELSSRALRIQQFADAAPLDRSREALELARAELDTVASPQEAESLSSAGELMPGLLDEMESEKPRGVSTGFPDLDYLLGGGMGRGQTLVVGARPSVGKSMLGINLAAAAVRKGVPTLVFSHEMTRSELLQRVLSRETGVPLTRIRTGALNDDDWERVARAYTRIQDWPLFIDDESTMTVADYRSRLRKLRKRARIGLVISDYIQLIKPFDLRVSREQQVAGISAAAKALAKDFDIPVVLLAQLSRQTEQRRDARPVMSDLRESGAIENDADVVALMHQEEDGGMEVNLVKNRQGERGRVELVWNPRIMRAEGK
jgi:replicative DNA helicase